MRAQEVAVLVQQLLANLLYLLLQLSLRSGVDILTMIGLLPNTRLHLLLMLPHPVR